MGYGINSLSPIACCYYYFPRFTALVGHDDRAMGKGGKPFDDLVVGVEPAGTAGGRHLVMDPVVLTVNVKDPLPARNTHAAAERMACAGQEKLPPVLHNPVCIDGPGKISRKQGATHSLDFDFHG